MTFEDLPDDWPTRALTDPDLTADVLDLLIPDRDRAAGAIVLLLCDADGRLLQPLAIALDGEEPGDDAGQLLGRLAGVFGPGSAASLVMAVARYGYSVVDDADRLWHQAGIDLARAAGVPLLGAYLVTRDDVLRLPDPLERSA